MRRLRALGARVRYYRAARLPHEVGPIAPLRRELDSLRRQQFRQVRGTVALLDPFREAGDLGFEARSRLGEWRAVDRLEHFLAVDRHVLGADDAQANFVAANFYYRDDDVVV